MSNGLPASDDSTIQWETKTSKNGAAFRVGKKIVVDSGQEKKIEAAVVARDPKRDPFGPFFGIAVNWPVEGRWITTSPDFVRLTGIEMYKLTKDGGVIYDYNLQFFTRRTYDYHFYDRTGDYYRVNVYRPGFHYVNYNSENPTIVFIRGD